MDGFGPYFKLWDCQPGIILCGAGVTYTNQVGGTSCAHPAAHGVFIPFPDGVGPGWASFYGDRDPLLDRWYKPEAYDLERAAMFLKAAELDSFFRPLKYSGQPLAEAWVPVTVHYRNRDGRWKELQHFEHQMAIITYPNSD